MTTLGFRPNSRHCSVRCLPATGSPVGGVPGTLTQAVQAAARGIDEKTLKSVARSGDSLAFQPKALLALISYCYARELYGSEVVEALLRSDENFRRLCRNEIPNARTIRAFRRENHKALHLCLLAGLRFLAEQKVAQGIVTRVSETHLSDEASRRIIMAMFTDTMELDRNQTPDTPVAPCYSFANRGGQVH
jgi:hypothetical protein